MAVEDGSSQPPWIRTFFGPTVGWRNIPEEEFSDLFTFLGLGDTPDSFTGQAGKAAIVNPGETGLMFGMLSSTFLGLTDTPDSFVGQGGKPVRVNAGATGLEFGAGAVTGDWWVNIADFGATGNGVTDDTAAINAAYASLYGIGGTVIWPKGNYRTTGTIVCGTQTWVPADNNAPTTFISTICPAGPNDTVLNYQGPTNGIALLFGKNKFFKCYGLNVSNNSGSLGTTVGIVQGGAGPGSFGNQVINALYENCIIVGFNVGIQDGNFGAASECTYINVNFYGCNTGWTTTDFNTLDHTFITCGMAGCGIGIDSGAAEGFVVYGGSATGSTITDFKCGANSSSGVTIKGFRSELSQCSVLGDGGADVCIESCMFKDTLPGTGLGVAVQGTFTSLIIRDSLLHGSVVLTACDRLIMHSNYAIIYPDTKMPFTVKDFPSGSNCHVSLKDNTSSDLFPAISAGDFEGFFRHNSEAGAPFFLGGSTGFGMQTVDHRLTDANVGIPYPYDYINLGHVRHLSEGLAPQSATLPTVVLATSATTAIGSPILTFASVPSTIRPGMIVFDTTVSAIPFGTFVISKTATTVTLSANVVAPGVGIGNSISFGNFTGLSMPGKNLRVMGQFATSGTLAFTFQRSVTAHTNNGNQPLTATVGRFFKSDIGKQITIAGKGNGGWTNWAGAGKIYLSSTSLSLEPANMQLPAILSGTPVPCVIGSDEPDANYMVLVTGTNVNPPETFSVTDITASGFTVRSSNASSTAEVTCLIIR